MDLDSRGRGRTGSSVTRAADATRLDVVGIGSMVLDRVHRVARILGREEKGILRAVGNRGPVAEHVGGVVLNQLGWAAALGLRAGICGRQAADRSGRVLRAAMDRAGITRDITLEGSASSFAEIFVDDAGERAIYMAPGATSETTAAHVRRDHADFIRRAARLVTEISQLPLDAVREALRIARAAGIATAVDLDVSPGDAVPGLGDERTLDEVLRAADLLKPARRAAQQLAPEAGEDPLALARCVRARFANRAVVVTDGAAGCAIAAEDFEGFVPATPVKAVDTTGAATRFSADSWPRCTTACPGRAPRAWPTPAAPPAPNAWVPFPTICTRRALARSRSTPGRRCRWLRSRRLRRRPWLERPAPRRSRPWTSCSRSSPRCAHAWARTPSTRPSR